MASESLVYRIIADNKRFKDELKRSKDELKRFHNQSNAIGRQIKSTLAGAFAVGSMVAFGKSVIETTAKFQKMEAVLTNTLGSNSAAQSAMEMITEFAAKTPFQVDGLTGAFVKLANQGFVPTSNEMRKLGDLAASTGKDFDQLAEAIIDAQVGEFERLKEFGIRSKKEGDQVKFTFKGVETQVGFTETAIRDYILSLGDATGVSGSMAAISETVGGKISNLEDNFTQLKKTIGDQSSGVIASLLDFANTAVAALGGDAESGLRLRGFGDVYDKAVEGAKLMTERLKGQITEQTQLNILIKRYKKEVQEVNKADGDAYAEKLGVLNGLLARQKEINDAIAQEGAERQRANKAYQEFLALKNSPTLTNRQSLGVGAPQEASLSIPTPNHSYYNGVMDKMKQDQENFAAFLQSQADELNAIINETIGAALINGITTAINTGSLEQAFASFLDTIGDGLQRFGKALLAFGIALKAFEDAPPGAKIAAGIAAIAAGAIVKKAASSLSASAGSGMGGSGSSGPSGSFQNNIQGQAQFVVTAGDFKLKGADIYGSLQVTNRQNSRNIARR